MGTNTDYFAKIAQTPTWVIGDRVRGRWNKIPFVGTVGNETLINHQQGPRVTVHLDLPIKHQDQLHRIIFLSPGALTALK